jgi:type I restriction enzyme S subunit
VRNLDKPACLNSGIFLVRPIHSFATEFMYWTLASRVFRVFCDLTSSGATIQHLYQNVFERFTFPAPSIREQRRIAAFLDRETAKIDLLIAKQEALIAKLEERRKALISRAVTRGMDPKARLKDSGVEWLGRIPEHWGVERNRWVFNERDERSEEGNEELLTVSHLTGVTPRADKDVGMFLAESLVGYKRCRSGDLAINTLWAWMGALGVSRCDGILSPAYNVYELAVDGEPRYFEYLFRTRAFIGEIVRWSKGVWSSRLRLYPREFLSIRVPLPPMSEQRAIIVHLDEEMLRMDGIARKAEALVEKLRERRTALISAAVTGKIRVAEADAVEGGARKRSAGVCHG